MVVSAHTTVKEGAVVQFQCPNNVKWTISQCVLMSWLPDPMNINCSLLMERVDIEIGSLRPSRFIVSYLSAYWPLLQVQLQLALLPVLSKTMRC